MIEVYRFLGSDVAMLAGEYDRLTAREVLGKPESFKFELFINKLSVRFQCSEKVQLCYIPLKNTMNYSSLKDLRTNSVITVSPNVQYVLYFRNSLRDKFVNKLQGQLAEGRFMQLFPLITDTRVVAEGNYMQQQMPDKKYASSVELDQFSFVNVDSVECPDQCSAE